MPHNPKQNAHLNWGLVIPGRPPTPSEGFAQAYHRVGPTVTQKTKKFDNGTCLTFGPDDLVDEFERDDPFANQLALVDKAIRDCRVARQRYEGAPNGDSQEGAEKGAVVLPVEFHNFRTQKPDPGKISQVTLESGTYTQVPSQFASCSTLVSVYSHPNKSDAPGSAHPGNSPDTRFGNGSRGPGFGTPFGTLQQHINRENDKRRVRGLARNRPSLQALLVDNSENEENQKPQANLPGVQSHLGNAARNNQGANGDQEPEQSVEGNVSQGLASQNVQMVRSNSAQPSRQLTARQVSASMHNHSYLSHVNPRLHPGQQAANQIYLDQIRALQIRQAELTRLAQRDAAQSGTPSPIEEKLKIVLGAQAALAAQIVPRPQSVPSVQGIGQGHRGSHLHNIPGPQAFIHHDALDIDGGYGFRGTLGRNIGTLPDIRKTSSLEDHALLDGSLGGIAGVQNYGLHGPSIQNFPTASLLYGAQYLGGDGQLALQNSANHQRGTGLEDINSLQNKFATQSLSGETVVNQSLPRGQSTTGSGNNHSQDIKKKTRRGGRSRALAQQADTEYGRYLDDLNEESRRQGDLILTGDMISGHARAQVRFNIQPPSPLARSHTEGEADDDGEEDTQVEPEEQRAWSTFMTDPFRRQAPTHHLSPAIFDPATSSFVTPVQPGQHLSSATRPPTGSPNVAAWSQEGRSSEPLRARPVLGSPIEFRGRGGAPLDVNIHFNLIRQRLGVPPMSSGAPDNRIFGELPGSVSQSRDPSPGGLQRSLSGRRLYEK